MGMQSGAIEHWIAPKSSQLHTPKARSKACHLFELMQLEETPLKSSHAMKGK
jgi:hypothetical protein